MPEDGYGVPVKVRRLDHVDSVKMPPRSTTQVLHLHGSLCVYPADYEIVPNPRGGMDLLQPRQSPLLVFDPDILADHFFPFGEDRPYLTYLHTDERLIAPVPSKARGPVSTFVEATYHSARKHIAASEAVVAVGYSFNQHDLDSYDSLLRPLAIRQGGLIVISPDAHNITLLLQRQYPALGITPMPYTFAQWATRDFRLPLSA